MQNGSEPLANARHEKFAQAVAGGESAMKAYVTAGYSAKAAKQNASELRENAGISKRVEFLQKRTDSKQEKSKQDGLKILWGIAEGEETAPKDIVAALNLAGKWCGWEKGTEVSVGDIIIRIGK